MKTLVVDDNFGCRLLLQEILKQMGHQVDCAENGRDAVLMYLKAAQKGEPYEFVSMDNNMPIMNGLQAVEMIRAFESEHSDKVPRITICFVSSDENCSCNYKEKYETDTYTTFLFKPLDILHFMKIVRSASRNSINLDSSSVGLLNSGRGLLCNGGLS